MLSRRITKIRGRASRSAGTEEAGALMVVRRAFRDRRLQALQAGFARARRTNPPKTAPDALVKNPRRNGTRPPAEASAPCRSRRPRLRAHRRSAGLRLDDVEAERLLFGQSRQQEIDAPVDCADVLLMAPKAHLFANRPKSPVEIAYRGKTAAAENFELHRGIT